MNCSESLCSLAEILVATVAVVADSSQLVPLNSLCFPIAVAPQQRNRLPNLNESVVVAAVANVVELVVAWPFVSLSCLCRTYYKSVACGLDWLEIVETAAVIDSNSLFRL